ncbi:MAG: bacteriophage holin [Pseudonocardiaceae bacterium]
MSYLISALAAAAGVVVLIALLMRLAGPVRGLARTARAGQSRFTDRSGLLTARIAALRVALTRRRRPRNAESPSGPPAA